jgi:hypothetical protein
MSFRGPDGSVWVEIHSHWKRESYMHGKESILRILKISDTLAWILGG